MRNSACRTGIFARNMARTMTLMKARIVWRNLQNER